MCVRVLVCVFLCLKKGGVECGRGHARVPIKSLEIQLNYITAISLREAYFSSE